MDRLSLDANNAIEYRPTPRDQRVLGFPTNEILSIQHDSPEALSQLLIQFEKYNEKNNLYSFFDFKFEQALLGLHKMFRHAIAMLTGFITVPVQLASLIGFGFTLFGMGGSGQRCRSLSDSGWQRTRLFLFGLCDCYFLGRRI